MEPYNDVVDGGDGGMLHVSGAIFHLGKNGGVDEYKKSLAGGYTEEDFKVEKIKGLAFRLKDPEKAMVILFKPVDLKKGDRLVVANAYAPSLQVARNMLKAFSDATKFEMVDEEVSDGVLDFYRSFGMKKLEMAKKYGRLI